jgi:predicted RNA-binding protein YlxR (DUF448 family)
MKTSKQGKIKHVPRRTCIACRKAQDKQSMIRIVNTPDGRIEVDAGGKMSGRGAYLCKNICCWEEGLKGSRLEHSLKTAIDREKKIRLLDWIIEYLGEVKQQSGRALL